MKRVPFYGSAAFIVAIIGCSRGPSRLYPPTVNSDAGASAVQQYDADKDGSISNDEVKKSPGLVTAFGRIDSDHDGRITAEEIDKRIAQWRESRIGLSSMYVRVTLDGVPIQDTEVKIVPEKFLGEAVKSASCVTEEGGFGRLRISPDPDENGVHLGFYQLQVSKKVNGKETIPARYNEKSELGVEIAHDVLDTQNFGVELRSR
jgi:hypothetical protein